MTKCKMMLNVYYASERKLKDWGGDGVHIMFSKWEVQLQISVFPQVNLQIYHNYILSMCLKN